MQRFPELSLYAATTSTPEPSWFFRTDANGNPRISWCEFLGTAEQFQKMDANSDGLIELSEAD